MPYLSNAGTFLISTLFGVVILAVMMRFLLQLIRADYYNPFSQFLVKVTNPILVPIRRIIPGLWGIDMASVTLMVTLQFVELLLTMLILGYSANVIGLLLLTVEGLLRLAYYIFLFSIIIQVIASWLQQGGYNPVMILLHQINEPLLGRARRMIPPVSGLDLSPLLVLAALHLISLLLLDPLRDFGFSLALGQQLAMPLPH
ncbi:hypothetical protein BOW53_01845 [Solemya pervernicosa gill symbiont]|uniref:YggT family protein n=2 Tax=Gammaproteobacteria incertae sedis TaxID=118884 RepID=A0A1T2LAG3_9GAMM|nr:YggT family protein [Candidatus Reidiella endopervernicosa]OOZ41936.1 hypothetical protein BOW53_01845 [Solemya pervernicosa gill symbiont]QKQ24902.1 YggT family protein [Candidatus Reidiella endopervernicosa]